MPKPYHGISSNTQALALHSAPQTQAISTRSASAHNLPVDHSRRSSQVHNPQPATSSSSSSTSSKPPSLSAPLPDMASLAAQRDRAQDDKQRVAWARQMLKYVERNFSDGTKISEPNLVKWTDEAISIIIANASSARPLPEALFLRGDLQASGAFPTYLAKNLKEAFNDFELSARMGCAPSWFRIGRDYEVLGDLARARDAYERGVHAADVGCIYRMGMANLLGQLEIPINHARAIAMLRDAADKADLDTPQPAYIYGMLLAREFSHVDIPAHLLRPANTSAAILENEARQRIQRAAYLNFAPAQYKCGWLFEYAQLGCAFDPLLSVQYYSLASQGGEIEADMALSKWFLCGAESYFDKNEQLAYTFADKAARKGLASAEFALGYYHEVGVGTERNVELARKWYSKAAAKDNTDAQERLRALQAPQALGISRQQHEAVMDDKLVRKRTQAKMLSDREGRSPLFEHDHNVAGGAPGQPRPSGGAATASGKPPNGRVAADAGVISSKTNNNNLELSRRKTMKMVQETAAGRKRPDYGYEGKLRSEPSVAPPMPSASIAATQQARAGASAGALASSGAPHRTWTSGRHGAGHAPNDNSRPTHASTPSSSLPSKPASAVASSSASACTKTSGGSDDVSKKPYNTFAEMGFAPQKQSKRDECVVC